MGKKKKKHPILKWFGLLFTLCILTAGAAAAVFCIRYGNTVQTMYREAEQFVAGSSKEMFQLSQTSTIYAADGTIISRLKGAKDTTYVEYENLPQTMCVAMISIEDKRFYEHEGVDYIALFRAGKALLETGELSQGGSTITMQLARNIFLTQDKNWRRKVEEIFIAWKLEEKYSKEDILEFYLNNIYFGNGYYGIAAASRGYFNKQVGQLNLSQIAFLCAIPNNPTLYDPLTNLENTISRRDRILKNMLNDEKISSLDYATAIREEIILERPNTIEKNDYIETYAYYCAARMLMKQEGFQFQYDFTSDYEKAQYDAAYAQLYNECENRLRSQGYQIYTSLDLQAQAKLQAAVDEVLSDYTEVNEEGVYELQASSVCIDNETGLVTAIVGGRSQEFTFYSFNRAYQSFRQPGSAIKPLIVYTPMLERGYTADTIVVDEKIEDGPRNANGTYLGEITLRTAVEKSVNVIAWKLFEELTPQKGLAYLKQMQFSHLTSSDYQLPSALGGFTEGVSSLEMAAAFAALENDGMYREPTCIKKITDSAGNLIFLGEEDGVQVYQHNAARAMTEILTGVMTNGTAKGLKLSHMPCAGKTGTTNDQKDGWFVGYTRYYTTSVWVGYDLPKKMKQLKGSSFPGEIWKQFMEELHEELPMKGFKTAVQIKEENQIQEFSPKDTELTEETEVTESLEEIEPIEEIQQIPEG